MRWHIMLYSIYDLKAAQMNVQMSRILELIFYEFKQNHNAMEATKNTLYKKWRRNWSKYRNFIRQIGKVK